MTGRERKGRLPGKASGPVNIGIDGILRLLPIPCLGELPGEPKRIRVLTVDGDSILGELARWQDEHSAEWRRIAQRLRLIAMHRDLPRLATIERVGPGRLVVEVKGDLVRLFGFEESDGILTFVCVGTFWAAGGRKKKRQDDAIREALALRERWMAAIPLAGWPDCRIEKGKGR